MSGTKFEFDAPRGMFTLSERRRIVFANATAQIVYRDSANQTRAFELTRPHRAQRAKDEWLVEAGDGRVMLTWHVSERGEVWLEVKNAGAEAIGLDELRVLVLDASQGAQMNLGAFDDLLFFQHGWQSWSPTRIVALARPAPKKETSASFRWKHVPHEDGAWTQRAEWFTLIGTAKRAALIGFVTAGRQLSEIRVHVANDQIARLEAVCFADGVTLAPNETYASEKLTLAYGEPGALYETYAAQTAREMKARVPERAPTGWCTWYQYFGENTMEDVRANMQKIRAARLPLDVIVIDDGYQTAIGDWTTIRAEKFPDGMRAAADEIKRAGFTPGIWVAPFGARHDSNLAREHPEYILRDERGEPVRAWEHWDEEIYALDLTHPGVEKFLRELFRTLGDEWGFEFFKLDFLFAGARPGKHHVPNTTRAEAYRRGLQSIREVIGDKFLLACGAPMATTVGRVDAMRVGADVVDMMVPWERADGDLAEPGVVNALRDALLRWTFHGRWWLNDADCVVLRGRAARGLAPNEIRTLASVIALSGGLALDSDNLAALKEIELDVLRKILPPTNFAARPLDFFANGLPSRLELSVATERGNWKIVAAINWEKRARQVEIALSDPSTTLHSAQEDNQHAYHVFDFWEKRYLGIKRGKVKMELKSHACALLIVKPVSERIELLATTFHFAGGLEVKSIKRKAKSFDVELEKRGRVKGEMFFAIPNALRKKFVSARVNGKKKKVKQITRGVISLALTLDERAQVEIEMK